MKFLFFFIKTYETLKFRIKLKTNVWKLMSLVKSHGENFEIWGDYDLLNPQNVSIGSNVSINNGVYINAMSPITIGDNVTLSTGAKLIAAGIDLDCWKKGGYDHLPEQDIVIGNNVWIGANALVLGGVKITGDFVVVAAGAVVTKDITESNVIVAGCPARIIKNL